MALEEDNDLVATCANSLSFSDLGTQSHLQSLKAESGIVDHGDYLSNFTVKNVDFYPVRLRTQSLDRFQEKVEQQLLQHHSNCEKRFSQLVII